MALDRDGLVLLTGRHNRRKQAAMMHRGSEPVQRRKMLRHGIALVLLEAITWAILRELAHQPVARDFGDDRGRRDRDNQIVAAGYRPDATLDQRALAAKTRRRDRNHAVWQLGGIFPGFFANHAGMVRKRARRRNRELPPASRISPLSTARRLRAPAFHDRTDGIRRLR